MEDEEEEGKVSPPPHSPLREALPLLDDIFHRKAGIAVGARRPKWTLTVTGPSISSPPQLHLALVTLDSVG
jgi:hypothetical protein